MWCCMTDTELTLLAKKAAKEYLTTNRPLNEVIAEYKSVHALTDEQTRRVIERANAAVYLEKYHSLGDDIRNVTFEVADPYVILQTSKLASRQPLRLTEGRSRRVLMFCFLSRLFGFIGHRSCVQFTESFQPIYLAYPPPIAPYRCCTRQAQDFDFSYGACLLLSGLTAALSFTQGF